MVANSLIRGPKYALVRRFLEKKRNTYTDSLILLSWMSLVLLFFNCHTRGFFACIVWLVGRYRILVACQSVVCEKFSLWTRVVVLHWQRATLRDWKKNRKENVVDFDGGMLRWARSPFCAAAHHDRIWDILDIQEVKKQTQLFFLNGYILTKNTIKSICWDYLAYGEW